MPLVRLSAAPAAILLLASRMYALLSALALLRRARLLLCADHHQPAGSGEDAVSAGAGGLLSLLGSTCRQLRPSGRYAPLVQLASPCTASDAVTGFNPCLLLLVNPRTSHALKREFNPEFALSFFPYSAWLPHMCQHEALEPL